MQQKKEFRQIFYDVKAQEVKEELARIEACRMKMQARNTGLRRTFE